MLGIPENAAGMMSHFHPLLGPREAALSDFVPLCWGTLLILLPFVGDPRECNFASNFLSFFFLLPRFVAWPLELGSGTHNPRFVVWPLELGSGTHNPRLGILLELVEGKKMGLHPMCLYSKYSVFSGEPNNG